jgi:hypothetical protein
MPAEAGHLTREAGIFLAGLVNGADTSGDLSEVLAGKRKLNRTQIAKLSRFFHVAPGAFIV